MEPWRVGPWSLGWRRWGRGDVGAWPKALWPAWCVCVGGAQCADLSPPLDLWLHSSWYLSAAIFSLVLLSGDANLGPPPCLPPVALLGMCPRGLCCVERGRELWAESGPFARRWASQDGPGALSPASTRENYLRPLKVPVSLPGDCDISRSSCRQLVWYPLGQRLSGLAVVI